VNTVIFANFDGTINPVAEPTTKQRSILAACQVL
jgi:hypothetical protein